MTPPTITAKRKVVMLFTKIAKLNVIPTQNVSTTLRCRRAIPSHPRHLQRKNVSVGEIPCHASLGASGVNMTMHVIHSVPTLMPLNVVQNGAYGTVSMGPVRWQPVRLFTVLKQITLKLLVLMTVDVSMTVRWRCAITGHHHRLQKNNVQRKRIPIHATTWMGDANGIVIMWHAIHRVIITL